VTQSPMQVATGGLLSETPENQSIPTVESLAQIGPPEPEAVLGGTEPTEPAPELAPHLVLELDGDRQEFRAHGQANQFLLVRHIDDIGKGGYFYVRAVTILALGQVLTDERPRLEGYLAEHGTSADYTDGLFDALSACWSGETMLPLVPSSNSSEPTETEATA
jgi:hypothetical protein